MPKRTAEAEWNGNLKEGSGTLWTATNNQKQPYTFASRFQEGKGTNPEELIGAALAGCFSMALSNMLDQADHTPETVNTSAEVDLDMGGDAPTIATITLHVNATVGNIDEDTFREIAEEAKNNCPVSRALKGVDIRLETTLKATESA